ncbi:MAG: hypothetical protein J7K22_00245 [Nanoarchaeota archaeon]|nr:hypothetical protein [Nanoarchaeota archaeon]
MKKTMVFLAAMFALAFVFGCIGGEKEEETPSGEGYTLKVNPQTVVAGGVVTIDLRIKNIFEKDMENVVAKLEGIPKTGYSGAETVDVGTIVANQEFPVIWTISTPDTEIKQTITPTAEICFDYTTDFYFDTAIVPRDLAAEEVQLQSGCSTGPLEVSEVGLDRIFIKESGDTKLAGSLNIQNTWQGKIKEIKKIEISASTDGLIDSYGVSYAKCGDESTTSIPASGDTDCDILSNELAIGNGLTAKVNIALDSGATTDTIEIERINGKIEYTYCYDVDIGTITVCPAGQQC